MNKSYQFAFLFFFFALNSAIALPLYRQTFLSEGFSQSQQTVKIAFFDADSTLRVSISGKVSANSPTDVMLLPGVEDKISELVKEGYLIAVVSNQGGIESGVITAEIADGALHHTAELIHKKNPQAQIHYFDFAEGSDQFRKPETGMALRLEKILNGRGLKVDWKNSFMVGDSAYKKSDIKPDGKPGTHFSNSDRLFAEKLGIPFYEPSDFFGWRKDGIDVFQKADEVTAYLQKVRNFRTLCYQVYN